MKNEKIKVGVIGCGKIAQVRHIPEYAANESVQLYALYDNNYERACQLAGQYGARAYKSMEELLEDDEIDAVSVCVPNFLHADISIKALEAGKHVLCEKPMAVTPEDCMQMVEAAKKNGRKLMIAQNQRLLPAHVKTRELIESGAIGDVLEVRTVFAHSGPDNWSVGGKNSWFFDKTRSAFGAMADLGVHKIDLITYLMGHKIVRAAAQVRTLDKKNADGTPITVDDNAYCFFEFDNGIAGTLFASWTNYGEEENWTSVYGTEGVIHVFRDPDHAIVMERGHEKTTYDFETIQTNENQTSSGVIDMFAGAIVNHSAYISGEDVLSSMKAVFACAESAEDHGRIKEIL